MANPEHVEIVKRGKDAIDEWREQNPDVELDLSGAKLIKVNLSGANLIEVDLSGAKLNWAGFHGANLFEVDLSGADLSRASLYGTKLTKVEMSGAKLSLAIFTENVIADIDLSEVIDLDTVHHIGPSSIGIDTLVRSKGNIPEVFLRGCGVPDAFITYIPSLVGKALDFYSCFISYSHADKSFARRLHDALQGRGIRCWLDEKQMLPGDDMHEQVDRGIRLWDKVLLCASENSLTSWWVDNELETAFAKERTRMKQKKGKKVYALIPLNLDGYLFSGRWKSGKATQVKSRLAADFVGWDKENATFEAAFDKVVKALQTKDTGREKPPKRKL